MRRTRWALIASILLLLAAVAGIYKSQREAQAKNAPAKPKALADNVNVSAQDWRWSKNDGERPIVEVRARNFEQKTDPPRVDLDKVELKLFHKDGKLYDLVKSDHAELKMEDSTMYAAGVVEITMGLASDPEIKNRLVTIKTSGVTFETQSGKATTEQGASFVLRIARAARRGPPTTRRRGSCNCRTT